MRRKMKQALALLCAGAITVTGMNISANVVTTKASEGWTWSPAVSESGYAKIPYAELTATADTEAANEGKSTGTGAASPGTGAAANIIDGVTSSYYHSSYSGDAGNQPARENNKLTGRNTITLTLGTAQTVKGFTYLPRQDEKGNGPFTEFSVDVKTSGNEEWQQAGQYTIAYSASTWNENRSEKEFLFDTAIDNVKEIRFTVTDTEGSQPHQHIAGAEISVLTPAKSNITAGYVTKSSGYMGTVSASKSSAAAGDTITFTAEPKEGNDFLGWYQDAEGMIPAGEGYTNLTYDVTATDQGAALYAKFRQWVSKQEEYWTYELGQGTLSVQDENDIWLYQIKDNGVWRNLEQADYNTSSNVWMSNGSTTFGSYNWGSIRQAVLVPFLGDNQQGVAYAWRAQEAGYVTIDFEVNIRLSKADAVSFEVSHVSDSEDSDGTILKQTSLSGTTPAEQLKCENIRVAAGDLIRISVGSANNDVLDVKPVITFKLADKSELEAAIAAAEQRITDEGNEYTDNYTEASRSALTSAIDSAKSVLNDKNADQTTVDAAKDTLNNALAGLTARITVAAGLVTGCENRGTAAVSPEGKADPNTEVTYTATASEGFEFAGWFADADAAGEAVSTDAVYTVTVNADTTLYAKFDEIVIPVDKTELGNAIRTAEDKQKEAQYDNIYSEESREALASALEAAKTVYDDPDAAQEDVNNAAANVQNALSGLVKEKYVVKVDGAVVATGVYNTRCTINAEDKEGQVFKGWKVKGMQAEDDNKVFSTEKSYSFNIANDIEFISVYDQEVMEEATAAMSNAYVYSRNSATKKASIRFVGQLTIPEGYTMVDAGLWWYGKSDLQSLGNENGKAAAGVKEVVVEKVNGSYQFSVTVNGVPDGKFVRGVIFVKVRDKDGNETYIYSGEEKVYNK